MDKNDQVSICIPNYNNAKYLKVCIDSALSQDYPNTEVVVWDDGSTDESETILSSYGDNIRFFSGNMNKGQPYATNKAVEMANGNFIIILHSDDCLLFNACSNLIELFAEHPDAVMAVGERQETNEHDELRHLHPFYNGNYRIDGIKQAKVFMFTSFLPCQVMFKKEVYMSAGGVDSAHIVNLDGLLWFKLSLHGDLLYRQDEVCIYRYHQENTTSNINRSINHMIDLYGTLRRMFELAEGHDYLMSFKDEAIKRVGSLALRYAKKMMHEGNHELALRQGFIAQYFNPDLTGSEELDEFFKFVDQYQKTEPLPFCEASFRQFSYTAPEGSILL